MKDIIEQGISEFKEKNYETSLSCFEKVNEDDEGFDIAQVYRFSCLIELNRHDEALRIVNGLIEKDPYEKLLWHEKVRCHIFLNEDEKALGALKELERIVELNDKEYLVEIARLYYLLDNYHKVVEYCDLALKVDKDYKVALYEKALAASSLEDDEMIDDVSKSILSISNNDLFSILPVFLLKLFSKKYEDCLNLVENCEDDDLKHDYGELFKGIIYNRMSDDLNAQILLADEIDLSVDDAIKLMLEFKKSGRDFGEVHGVSYFIL
jgi:tetratricopeptide (TPR) repeat protein